MSYTMKMTRKEARHFLAKSNAAELKLPRSSKALYIVPPLYTLTPTYVITNLGNDKFQVAIKD